MARVGGLNRTFSIRTPNHDLMTPDICMSITSVHQYILEGYFLSLSLEGLTNGQTVAFNFLIMDDLSADDPELTWSLPTSLMSYLELALLPPRDPL